MTTNVTVPYSNGLVFGDFPAIHFDVALWLAEHVGGANWHCSDYYESYRGGMTQRGLIFEFTHANDAILFKLAWGGA